MCRVALSSALLCIFVLGCGGAKDEPPKPLVERASLLGHTEPVACLALNPDDTLLASGGHDGKHRLWEVQSLSEKVALSVHKKWVQTIAFSPDGKYLATGGGDYIKNKPDAVDGRVFLWNGKTGALIRQLKSHTHNVDAVDFSADSRWLVSGSWDGDLILHDLEKKESKTFPGHPHRVYSARFSPDGKVLASGGGIDDDPKQKGVDSGELHLREMPSGKTLWKKRAHRRWISMLAFHPKGRYLVTGSQFDPGPVKLWDLQERKEIPLPKEMGFKVASVCYSSEGNYLILGCFDGSIRIQESKTGNDVLHLKEHAGRVYSVAITRDGKTLFTGGGSSVGGGEIKVWDLPQPLR